MAIASASKGLQLKKNAVVFGELGLSGEIRHVPYVDKRLQESIKLGFEGAIGPTIRTGKKPAQLHEVLDIRAALNGFLES
jgi:DNA repair protein RadA/Sms